MFKLGFNYSLYWRCGACMRDSYFCWKIVRLWCASAPCLSTINKITFSKQFNKYTWLTFCCRYDRCHFLLITATADMNPALICVYSVLEILCLTSLCICIPVRDTDAFFPIASHCPEVTGVHLWDKHQWKACRKWIGCQWWWRGNALRPLGWFIDWEIISILLYLKSGRFHGLWQRWLLVLSGLGSEWLKLNCDLCVSAVLQLCLQQRRSREQLVEQGIMPRELSHHTLAIVSPKEISRVGKKVTNMSKIQKSSLSQNNSFSAGIILGIQIICLLYCILINNTS